MLLMWLIFLISGTFCGFLSNIFFVDKNSEVLSLCIIIITTISVIITIAKNTDKKVNFLILYFSYFLNLLLVIYDRFIASLDSTDPEAFHRAAIQKMNGDYSLNYGSFYTDLLSYIYKLFSLQRIAAQYFNVLLAITSALILIRILKLMKIDEKYITLALAFFSFSPNRMLMTAVLRREALIVFFISISVYNYILWWNNNKMANFILSMLFCLLGSLFHSGIVGLAVGYLLSLLLYNRNENKFRFNYYTIGGMVFFTFLILFLNVRFGSVLFAKLQFNDASQIINNVSIGRGSSGYSVGFYTGNIYIDLVINTPIRVVYYVLSPMPWDWRGLGDVVAFCLSSLFYFVGYVLFYKVMKKKIALNHEEKIIIVFFLCMIVSDIIFAWGVKNAGTAMRHRDKFIIPYIVMSVLCYKILTENKHYVSERRKLNEKANLSYDNIQ